MFHKWKYVRLITDDDSKYYWPLYRICQKCGKAERAWCGIHGDGEWINLDEERTEILKKKVKDKGKYFVLYEVV